MLFSFSSDPETVWYFQEPENPGFNVPSDKLIDSNIVKWCHMQLTGQSSASATGANRWQVSVELIDFFRAAMPWPLWLPWGFQVLSQMQISSNTINTSIQASSNWNEVPSAWDIPGIVVFMRICWFWTLRILIWRALVIVQTLGNFPSVYKRATTSSDSKLELPMAWVLFLSRSLSLYMRLPLCMVFSRLFKAWDYDQDSEKWQDTTSSSFATMM